MKPTSNPFLRTSAVLALACTTVTYAADLTWDGAATANWNTTDANWTGSTWTAGDNAFFNTSTGAITLTEPISAGNVTFGLSNANLTGSFSGAALSISGDLLAQADGNNGPGGPLLSFSNDVSIAGDLRIARRVVEVTAGNFTANRVLSAGSWGRLLISGGNVTITNGIDDSINGGNTMSVVLFGGTLSTPFIKTTSAGFTNLPNDGVVLSGGTLIATASSADFIQTYQAPFNWGDRGNVGVGSGGTVIDTNGFDITITKAMQNYAAAGVITKTGAGTLTLTNVNTYSGGTTLDEGTIVLDGANGGNSRIAGPLTLNPGTAVSLINDDGTGLGFNPGAKVTSLTINGGTVSSAGVMHIWNYSGGITMTGGTLQSNGGTSNPNGPQMEWNSANVTTLASADTATIGGRIRIRADGGYPGITFTVADGDAATDLLVSAAITEADSGRSITKNGPGTMVLSGANNYTGSTTVNEGVLSLTNPVLDDAASVFIEVDGVMNLDFTGQDIVGSLDIDGSGPLPGGVYDSTHPTYGSYFTGTGALVVLGADGTWTSLADGNWSDGANWLDSTVAVGYDSTATFNAATGATVTVDGNRIIGNLSFDASDYTIAGPDTLTLDSAATPIIDVTAGRTTTISAGLAGIYGMEKTGEGTLVLSGVKTYSGGTYVTSGTLELFGGNSGNSQIRGQLVVEPGATLAITAGDGTGFGWNSPVTSILVDGGTLNAASGSHIGFGSYANLTLDGGAAVQGSWQWNGNGLLGCSSVGDTTNTISGNLTLRGDAGAAHTFNVVDGASATDLQVDANLGDQWPEVWWVPASGLTKSGDGTMVLNGTNTYDGNTIVNDGTLEITASSSLRFRPTSNGSNNSVSGSATGGMSFLGTVSLDLTAVDATDGNVWNLFNLGSFTGPAPTLIPAAVTSTTLGAFSEVSTGVWELPVTGAKWVFTTADGNLAYMVTANDFDSWKDDNGVTGGENDDDDGDGLTNFEEYAFGLDPTGASSVNPIAVPLDASTGNFSYTRRTQTLTELTYSVWYSTDLSGWTEDTGAVEGTPSVSGDVETVPVTLSPALLTNSKLFIQVRAE
jgi:autotransporter-associated beta strand protein